ncbi:MAG: hypothetical protein ACE5HF_00435 [Gemmatimonadota bacterium]
MTGAATRSYTLDVFVEGRGVRRNAEVEVRPEGLALDGAELQFESLFWVTRRAGLLLLFSPDASVALSGRDTQIDGLAGLVEERIDQTASLRRLLRQLGHEGVLFAAGSAVSGTIEGDPVRGLCVAAATRRALHLVSGRHAWRIAWPVERAERRSGGGSGSGGDVVALGGPGLAITLRYLFPEEIGALLKVARSRPAVRSGDAPLELFSRGEVDRPTPAELPEFSVAAGALQETAEAAAARLPEDLKARALTPPYFFETHFLEVGEIALGPLLLRKSAAASAGGLARAVKALNASGLQQDTRAAVVRAADRLVTVYEGELERLAATRRLTPGQRREFGITVVGRDDLVVRMQAPFEDLWTRFRGLEDQEAALLGRLAAFEAGPPGEDDGGVREVAIGWRNTMERLDRAYGRAWSELADEIERTWSAALLPRLVRVAALRRRRLPEWAQLVILALVTLVLAAGFVFLVVR